jgi:flagellar hook-associated protein 1
MSVGRLMDIAVRTMQTYQQAIDIASHNVSNANNKDYSRQKVVFASVVGEKSNGAGVRIQDIQRMRDVLNDSQIRKYLSQNSDAQTRSSYLSQIETVISEPTDNGISNYISTFFNAWDTLTTNPTSTGARSNIIQSAQEISTRFKEILDGLNSVKNSVQNDVSVKVDQVNSDLKEICSLNQKIYELEVRGDKANDLTDQRDKVINDLSNLVNINVNINDKGTAIVSVGGIQGADLNNYNQFQVLNENGKIKIVTTGDKNIGAYLTGGEIFASVDLYSNKIPDYINNYQNLATSFANSVNSIHKTGYTLSQSGVSTTNINFFGKYDDEGKLVVFDNGELIINSDILNNPSNIAASDTANNDGNGNIAGKIARLGETKISTLNNQTILESYNSILSKIGSDKVSSDNTVDSSNLVLQQLDNQKSSVSGVSLDEEMSNILIYQRAYDASSKLIKVADELMQTLLGMMA